MSTLNELVAASLAGLTVKTEEPVLLKRVGGVMEEIQQPTGSIRKPIEVHLHAPLEEHRPSEGEIVMLSGAVRKDS